MKRTVAVCLMAGVLLAMSTAAFASPVTVDLSSGTLVSDSTVTSGFNKSLPNITWFQPFSTPAQPDATAAPYSLPGGGTYALDFDITGATLTIWANGISPLAGAGPNPERDYVWSRVSSSDPWTAIAPPAYLNAGDSQTGNSTTVFAITDPTVLASLTGTTGSNIQVRLSDYPANQNDTVTKSQLAVTGTYTWSYTYDVPDPPAPAPVVPAPGAILLASMGAGLVSWLRARKSL